MPTDEHLTETKGTGPGTDLLRDCEEAAPQRLNTMSNGQDGRSESRGNENGLDNGLDRSRESVVDTDADIVEKNPTGEHATILQRRHKDMEDECRPTFYDLSQTSLDSVELEHGQLEP